MPMGAGSSGQRTLLSEFIEVFTRNKEMFEWSVPEDSMENFWNSRSVNAYVIVGVWVGQMFAPASLLLSRREWWGFGFSGKPN